VIVHAIVLPVLIPVAAAVLMLFAGERRLGLQRGLAAASCLALVVIAADLLVRSASGVVLPYFLGDWQAPFGIALVLDRLAALMVALTAVVAAAALAAATTGRDPVDARGRYFHPLFQFQLMGLNGAFLTGDLFNLFVFFEVLLIASYCMLAHGQGAARLKAAVHFVVINLAASGLFLLGVGTLYAVTGTLNMADLALRVPQTVPADVPLVRAGALLLLVVFAVKAAAFPLYLWLPGAYSAAAAPVAALFAIMTKVGVYSIVRVHGVIFGPGAGDAALIAGPWLLVAAIATAIVGAVGALGAASLSRMTAYLTIASIGTLLIAVSLFSPASLAAAFYYLVHSTLAVAALFLLSAEIGARRGAAGDRFQGGAAMVRPLALGIALVVAGASMVGLPPFAGFLGKLMILGAAASIPATPVLWTVILASGLMTMVALVRAGNVLFWQPGEPAAAPGPTTQSAVVVPAALLACGVALAVFAAPIKAFANATARQIADTPRYAARALGDAQAETVRRLPDAATRPGDRR
jgi:multicomponent K+:H+ antiporter subunit D